MALIDFTLTLDDLTCQWGTPFFKLEFDLNLRPGDD